MNKIECESCIKRKTIYCPNSEKCFATKDKPFYQNRIMLLEETQELKNQQKEFIEYLENEIQKQKDYGASFGLFIDRDISEYISEKIEICQDFLSKYKEIIGGKE